MITIKDLANNLIAKHQVSASDAELFIQQMVEVINDGLLRDRQVKIKGFGTFKLQTVKERASVNVNTGERVMIGEHDKVTFMPDNTMKDLINKPFSQFDTVIVSDDSPLLDGSFEVSLDVSDEDEDDEEIIMPEVEKKEFAQNAQINELNSADETKETQAENDKQPAPVVDIPKEEVAVTVAEPVVVETPVENDDDIPATETTVADEPAVETTVAEPVSAESVVAEPEAVESVVAEPEAVEQEGSEQQKDEQGDDAPNECSRQYPHCRNIFIYYGIIINIIVAIIAFAIGYFVGKNNNSTEPEQTVICPVAKKKAPAPKPKVTATPAAKSVKTDSAKVEKPAETKESKAEQTQEKQPEAEKPIRQYDTDARVRTGAYYIMGTQQVVTVKDEQTLKEVSKKYLGPGLECYTEAYNDYKDIKKGDKIKIPTLKLKKLVNKHKK